MAVAVAGVVVVGLGVVTDEGGAGSALIAGAGWVAEEGAAPRGGEDGATAGTAAGEEGTGQEAEAPGRGGAVASAPDRCGLRGVAAAQTNSATIARRAWRRGTTSGMSGLLVYCDAATLRRG